MMKNGSIAFLLTTSMLSLAASKDDTMHAREATSTVGITIDHEGEKPAVLYTANISSNKMICYGVINKMNQLDNMAAFEGTFSSGFNATAFLQPGINSINLYTVPNSARQRDPVYHPGEWSQLTLFGAFEDGHKDELTSLRVTDRDGHATTKTSALYPDNHQSPLTDTEGHTIGWITRFSREVNIKTIPRWRWVDATPFNEKNAAHMKMLYEAYSNLLVLMRARDFEGLKMAWSLSGREKAKAEAYYSSADEFFEQVGFESKFNSADDAAVKPRREWTEYTLKSYVGGRLVRLEDKYNDSPLQITSKSQDRREIYTPYFSIIDGRVVVSR
jgi:hypothetical protein